MPLEKRCVSFLVGFSFVYYMWLLIFQNDDWLKTLGGNVLTLLGLAVALYWIVKTIQSPSVNQPVFWKLILSGLSIYFAAECLWLLYETFWRVDVPIFGFLDFFFLAHALFYIAAFLFKFKQEYKTARTVRMVFDMLITMTIAVSFSWYFIIGAILADVNATPMDLIINLSYPTTDLGMLLAGCTLFFGLDRSHAKKEMLLILLGLLVQITANSIYLSLILNNGYESGNITDPMYVLSALLIALAGRLYGDAPAASAPAQKRIRVFRLLIPYAGVTILFIFMLFYAGFNALTVGATISIILLMIRQAWTIYENQTLYDQLLKQTADLSINEQRYRSLFDHYPEAAYSVDVTGRFQSMNQAAADLLGFEHTSDAIGMASTTFLSAEDKKQVMIHTPSLLKGEACEFEISLERKGRRRIIQITSIPIIVDGQVIGIYGIGKDMTEQKSKQKQIKHMAYHDALTNLPNRLAFEKKMMKLIQENHQPFAVLYMDLDGFKQINDTLGHQAGDELLISVGNRLSSSIRSGDMASRQGGDEFALLISGFSSLTEVEEIAKGLLHSIKEPHTVAGQALSLTPSIGISVYPKDGQSPDHLLKKADTAMYDVKQNGKGSYQFYEDKGALDT